MKERHNKRWLTPKEKAEHRDRLATFIRENRIRTQGGMLVLYKAVRDDLGSWFYRNFHSQRGRRGDIYKPGAKVSCRRFCRDPFDCCGKGLHVSTLRFAVNFSDKAPTLLRVFVHPEDVVCVPHLSEEGKIRVRCLYVDRILVKDKFRSMMWAHHGWFSNA